MKLVLITGFLGSGKTTFLSELLIRMASHKIGVIMNEFGKVGIDGTLVQHQDLEMIELNNGSIFCACIKDNFLKALITLSSQSLDYVIIEASGLADPSNIQQILHTVNQRAENKYAYSGAICIVDAVYFLDYVNLLPAIERQIRYSHFVIINKMDLQSEEKMQEIETLIKKINPLVTVYKAVHCQVDLISMLQTLSPESIPSVESSNTQENRPKTVVVDSFGPLQHNQLIEFLEAVTPFTFRIKGFVHTEIGVSMVSCVGRSIRVIPWDKDVEACRLVFISSCGIKMVSEISKSWKKHLAIDFKMQS
ncbi:MAG: GTP-binding protein [Tissierellales bacterium]|nr:GTP-binding protein [Tissierellales bacterium]MBN2828348.1 GTP-binding protein [Tissierellales bacterium]